MNPRLWIQIENTYSIEETGLHGRNNGHQIYNIYFNASAIKHLESIQKRSAISDGWYMKDLAIIMGTEILNLLPTMLEDIQLQSLMQDKARQIYSVYYFRALHSQIPM